MKTIYDTDKHKMYVLETSTNSDDIDNISKDKKKLLAYLSKIRSKYENSGVDFNGIVIKTDEGSIAKITSTIMALQSGMVTSVDWKGHNGWIKGVELDTMMGIAMKVSAHVQKCFSTENKIADEIFALADNEVSNYNIQDRWDIYFTSE